MRIVALLASYNEERFIADCLRHFVEHEIEVYLLDNESTDRTVAMAEPFLGRGLIGLETLPRSGVFRWREILRRKEELAASLEADWFIHADPDEELLPPRSGITVAQAIAEADAEESNAINFLEFTFLPSREAPDHDHPEFKKTMRSYYPLLPAFPHRLKAWKRQHARVDLASSGGHRVRFPGLRMHPISFSMRHFLFLSLAHAREKYRGKIFDPDEVREGWHQWRVGFAPDLLTLPPENEMRRYTSDAELDPSSPHTRHYWAERVTESGGLRGMAG